MDVAPLILYLIVGCIALIILYLVLRLFAFSLFKSYFQAKSEFLTMLKKKKEDFKNEQQKYEGAVGEAPQRESGA